MRHQCVLVAPDQIRARTERGSWRVRWESGKKCFESVLSSTGQATLVDEKTCREAERSYGPDCEYDIPVELSEALAEKWIYGNLAI
jgi:hypothetical protein